MLSDVTDMLGAGMNFCLRFPDGIYFATATEVEEKWVEIAVQFMENHLITN